ncbi:hypothetical protein UFOVP153_45 [uncultured Caudovirales phage]|uniref:Uncharacterized protein n=1 Tax=uncultured Caudovirales phage TaxID=2100421 RepID=A0A6J5KZ64_9CAUD|nr:hypothetical protein UFOVP69_13 [uncultured Caudovirales phage]CAB5170905.1 hypothetical protein UFOVP153_45 [uncultured Caudovirales phage]
MGLYNINFNNKIIELLPPDKRKGVLVRWLQSLISPIQYLRDKILGDYKEGSDYAQWIAGTYAKGARVVYKQVVYESLVDSNTAQPPSQNWATYLPSFMGVDKRILFNGQKLVMEYALNQRFLSTFRQPPYTSDIYITNIDPSVIGFLVGETEPYSSSVGQTTASDAIGYPYTFIQINNFQINIPAAVYATTNIQEITDFVRRFIPASLNFIKNTY